MCSLIFVCINMSKGELLNHEIHAISQLADLNLDRGSFLNQCDSW